MAEKKDGAAYWQPKQIAVRAVRWEPSIDHPNVKKRCGCGKGAQRCMFCASGNPVLEHEGSRTSIQRGDYIIGPDAQGLLHVFSGKEFEEAYEPVTSQTPTIHARQAQWLASTFAINSAEALLMWLRINKDSRWAQSNPGAAQEMYEHAKFLDKHVEAMRRFQRGE
jgi:hypothetical protein